MNDAEIEAGVMKNVEEIEAGLIKRTVLKWKRK